MWDHSNISARKARMPHDWYHLDGPRARVLARDHYTCQWPDCTAQATHVDHIEAGSHGTVSDNELQALCERHHTHKSASEGGHARAAAMRSVRRAPPRHPGLKW